VIAELKRIYFLENNKLWLHNTRNRKNPAEIDEEVGDLKRYRNSISDIMANKRWK